MSDMLTGRARRVLELANQEAQRLGLRYVGAEHILLGILEEGNGIGADVLKNLGLNLNKAKEDIESKVATPGAEAAKRFVEAKDAFARAVEESQALGHGWVGTEHLLLGLVQEGTVVAQVLKDQGLGLAQVRDAVLEILNPATLVAQGISGGQIPRESPPVNEPESGAQFWEVIAAWAHLSRESRNRIMAIIRETKRS